MITTYPIQIVRFIVLILIQILIANNILLNFGEYVNIYVYQLFIMLLPVSTSWWVLLIVSFSLGISVDMFTNTLGLHASTCLLIAFLRPKILAMLAPRDGYDFNTELYKVTMFDEKKVKVKLFMEWERRQKEMFYCSTLKLIIKCFL